MRHVPRILGVSDEAKTDQRKFGWLAAGGGMRMRVAMMSILRMLRAFVVSWRLCIGLEMHPDADDWHLVGLLVICRCCRLAPSSRVGYDIVSA